MLIERTSSEVIIRLPASVDTAGLQRPADYLPIKKVGGRRTVNDLSNEENNC